MPALFPLEQLGAGRFETAATLKKLASSSRALAELKGIAASIPNQGVLINTLGLQEAKDSSEIENIVTTHDELFRDDVLPESFVDPAAKEVLRYRQALRLGFESVRRTGLTTANNLIEIQGELERNNAGFRKLPGTALKSASGETVYTPPQAPGEIVALMGDLERFINDDRCFSRRPADQDGADPSPVREYPPVLRRQRSHRPHPERPVPGKEGLLDVPVLYLSRHIVRTKSDYYRLLQAVRDHDAWEEWVLYMLEAVEQTGRQTIVTIRDIKAALFDYKHRIRAGFKFYSQDLINNLFTHPYTKIEFVQRDLKVSRLTATKYIEALAEAGLLPSTRSGAEITTSTSP